MARRKKKAKPTGLSAVLIVTLILLNLMGIAYGFWDTGLSVITSIFTGSMGVQFASYSAVEGLTVVLNNDRTVMHISGTVDETENELVSFEVINMGSVPAGLINQTASDNDIKLEQDPENQSTRIYLEDGKSDYSFEIVLTFGSISYDRGDLLWSEKQ
jgi:hypothetical protein